MISRIGISVSIRPDFEQVGLQSFELAAKRFHTSLDVFPGTVSILQQKGQRSSTVQRNQGLNNMVTTDDRFVIRSRKLKYGLCPHVSWVIEIADVESGDSLQFGKCRRREDRPENRFQFGDAGGKHLPKPLTVYADRLEHDFRLSADSRHRLRARDRAPELKIAIKRREQRTDCLAHGCK